MDLAVQKQPATRGRPRKFAPAEILDPVLSAFGRGGYAETSLDDLTAATGVNRPSLYAVFGDKRGLFLTAVDARLKRMREEGAARLAQDDMLEKALLRFGRAVLDAYAGEAGQGCPIVVSTTAAAHGDPEIRDRLREGLEATEQAVLARLKRDQARGVVRAGADLPALARVFAGALDALGLRARAGEPREALEASLTFTASLVASTAVIRGLRG